MSETKNTLIPILEQIERDKGVKKEELLKLIEASLISAYRKHYGRNVNVLASIDPDTAEIKASVVKKVVESVKNPNEEISLEEAQSLKLKGKLNEDVQIPVDTEDFSRIAAQIAKQIIIQKIREVERTSLFEEFSGKENSLSSGSVFRFAERNIIVDLGRAEAILPMSEQVRRERFNLGDRVKVLVLRVEKGNRGPMVIVSRSHPDLLRRLLELEVPEINEKVVEIVEVVRDPGFRSKIAVKSNNSKVDPVGTCVGVRGSRIRPIIDELRGERIDLIAWNSEPEKYIAASLAPAKVLSVNLTKEPNKTAEVLVSNDMYFLAVGKNGQNVRLASKLTGWNIDVRSESQRKEEAAKNVEAAQKKLSLMEGVGPKITEVLIKGGWTSPEKIANSTIEQLTTLQGIGEKTAEKLIESAKSVVEKKEEDPQEKKEVSSIEESSKDESANERTGEPAKEKED
ncbi:MAG: transcription termination/antitermination protein NusA [Elusimicrobia bacterium]|nr:transcription termination/antitermination protein NusA [Elusimicrobiota bacterium]